MIKLLIGLFILIPAIVGFKLVDLSHHEFGDWLHSDVLFDVFSYYKSQALLYLSLVTLPILFFSNQARNSAKLLYQNNQNLIYFLIMFFMIIILSSLTSAYPQTSWFGIPDRFEGALVWLCYLFFFYLITATVSSEKNIQWVTRLLLGLIFFEFLICLMQLFELDPWQNPAILRFLSHGSSTAAVEKVHFVQTEFATYGTLYHYNYFGSFLALVVPFLFQWSFKNKNIFSYLLFTSGLFYTLASGSRAGMVGVISTLLLISVFGLYQKHFKLKELLKFYLPAVMISITLGFFHYPTRGRWLTFLHIKQNMITTDTYSFKYSFTSPTEVKINFDNQAFVVKIQDNNFIFFDASGNRILHRYDEKSGRLIFNTNYFSSIRFFFLDYQGKKILALNKDKVRLGFILEDGKIYIFDLARKTILRQTFDADSRFEIPFAFASGRGYIWNRTLSLVTKSPWLGFGADTFIYYFPVNDIIGRYQTYGDTLTYVDKPHNFYIQLMVNFGILGLLSFFSIVIYCLRKNFNSAWSYSVIAFLITAIFNDSLVSVNPLFWLVLALTFSDYQKSQSKADMEPVPVVT